MLVVVGGHSRNIGKTSVMASLIRAIPEAHWTAVKITQYGHGICSSAGKPCECAVRDCVHPYALSEERDAAGGSDTSRFLAAGASRSWWLRTEQGALSHAVPALRRLVAESENAILESNSALEFFSPDFYIVVLDPAVTDFKPTSRRYLQRADALVLTRSGSCPAAWGDFPGGKARFQAPAPGYESPELIALVRHRLSGSFPPRDSSPLSGSC